MCIVYYVMELIDTLAHDKNIWTVDDDDDDAGPDDDALEEHSRRKNTYAQQNFC